MILARQLLCRPMEQLWQWEPIAMRERDIFGQAMFTHLNLTGPQIVGINCIRTWMVKHVVMSLAHVALSADGMTLAAGAPDSDDINGKDFGHVQLCTCDRGAKLWNQLGQTLVREAERDHFGSSVISISYTIDRQTSVAVILLSQPGGCDADQELDSDSEDQSS